MSAAMNTPGSKKRREALEGLDLNKTLTLDEAVALVCKKASAKFDESVDVALRLGIDARKSDQGVRGAVSLPHGTGRTVRVAVFAPEDKAAEAKAAGADVVGLEELATQVKAGQMDFDVVIATPDAMRVVGQLGQVLGPRGLMPNPKVGTVTADVSAAVKRAKAGEMRYRNDKNGIIHGSVGRVSFTGEHLVENILAVLADLKKAKPSAAKGVYFRRLVVSSTMGIGFDVDLNSLP